MAGTWSDAPCDCGISIFIGEDGSKVTWTKAV
jgi:hypothetical protein